MGKVFSFKVWFWSNGDMEWKGCYVKYGFVAMRSRVI